MSKENIRVEQMLKIQHEALQLFKRKNKDWRFIC